MFFEVRTKRTTVEGNAYKTVKELWLFDVESFTEAEAKVILFMNKQFGKDQFQILKIQPSKIAQIGKSAKSNPEEDPFYKVKVDFLFLNDKGRIRREHQFSLIRAESPESAVEESGKMCDETLNDYEIMKVEKTKFSGVILIEQKQVKKESKK